MRVNGITITGKVISKQGGRNAAFFILRFGFAGRHFFGNLSVAVISC